MFHFLYFTQTNYLYLIITYYLRIVYKNTFLFMTYSIVVVWFIFENTYLYAKLNTVDELPTKKNTIIKLVTAKHFICLQLLATVVRKDN